MMLTLRKRVRTSITFSSAIEAVVAKEIATPPHKRVRLSPSSPSSPPPSSLPSPSHKRYMSSSPPLPPLGESSSTHVLPMTGEPVHYTMPLLAARLIRHDGQIEEIYDHLEEIPLERFEGMEHAIRILYDDMRNMSVAKQGMNPSAIEQLITQRVADAMTAYEANRASRNGTHNEASGSAGGVEQTVRGYSYKEFMTCKPHNFKGTNEAVGLTRWFEKMEPVFHINNYAKIYQVKFAACTLLDDALTWWNLYVKTIGLDFRVQTLMVTLDDFRTWPCFAPTMVSPEYKMIKRNACPKLRNHNSGNRDNEEALGRAFVLSGGEAVQDPNVVTDTFLLSDHYATVLFDLELANEKLIGANTIIRGCTLNFLNHPFNIDLIPVKLESFDIIVGMDWLSKYHTLIVNDEKLIRIPFGDETLTIQVNKGGTENSVVYCDASHKGLRDVLMQREKVWDKVTLKVSPWKGVIRFGKLRKLNPRYIGPFKIITKLDESLVISLDKIQVDDKLHFIEEPVKIMDREIKQLKRSRIPIIKVLWNSKIGNEFMRECEDQFRDKYLHLFSEASSPVTQTKFRDEILLTGEDCDY
nr:putative reverse transcriptase domain-containing protein [Tanacetum cinerariifolium]